MRIWRNRITPIFLLAPSDLNQVSKFSICLSTVLNTYALFNLLISDLTFQSMVMSEHP